MFTPKNDSNGSKKLKKDKNTKKVLKVLSKQKKKRGIRQRRNAPPKTSQHTLAYRRMLEDGLCEIREGVYSKTFNFTDINYATAGQEEQENTFSSYCELLNSCDGETKLQLNIINKNKDRKEFEQEMKYELQNDGNDEYREEMNTILLNKLAAGNSSLEKKKYFTVTQSGNQFDQVKASLNRLQDELISQFEGMGCETKELTGLDRLELANQILRPDTKLHFDYEDLLFSKLTTHSAIAPNSFNMKYKKHRFMMGDQYAQVLYLRNYPPELSDKLIADITDIPSSLEIAVHIEPINHLDALELVKRKLTYMESQKVDEQKKALKSGYDPEMIPPELKRSLHEAEDLLDQMQEDNEKLFNFTFLVMLANENEQVLDDLIEQVMQTGRKNNCEFGKLDYMQEEGLNSILPWGENFVPIQRTLTTASTAVFIPFTAQELTQEHGKYYGLNAVTKNIISLDRRMLSAPNGFIFGKSGSGKSFASKKEIVNILLNEPDAEVIVIDPEREYSILANELNGEIIRIAAGSPNHINLFDINQNYADDDDPVSLKTDFALTLCDLLVGGKLGLNGTQKSLIDRVCSLMYQEYFERGGEMPTFKVFSGLLKEQPEPEAKQLALQLELYTDGSLSVFSHETNVDINNRFVVFDIKDLGKQLKTMGMLTVLDQVWNRATRNRSLGKRTYLYIDEIQLLVTNEYAEAYFFELWSRARKWGIVPTGITQNVATMLLSANVERMLSNSDFIMMLNQSKTDRRRLADLLHLSARQERYLTNAAEGEGLLCAGNAIIPFYDDFPRDTKLYKMMSTKIDDVYKYQKEEEAG
ncbi:VirB4-like conjugal transfer ATPase, CD1110 family [Enterococcus sp. AZ163]|uniref:VirB4-like conjugal transfer ATPase, CD1110 family n=1 Tax=Enterococcus sp. AZ163 TaxID=2774638 RepID=UPI003D2DA881